LNPRSRGHRLGFVPGQHNGIVSSRRKAARSRTRKRSGGLDHGRITIESPAPADTGMKQASPVRDESHHELLMVRYPRQIPGGHGQHDDQTSCNGQQAKDRKSKYIKASAPRWPAPRWSTTINSIKRRLRIFVRTSPGEAGATMTEMVARQATWMCFKELREFPDGLAVPFQGH